MRNMKRVTVVLILSVVMCRSGFAQTAPFGRIGPSGGQVAAGIAVLAGAGVGITYLALHNRGTVVGCFQVGSGGNSSLIDENKKAYALIASGSVVVPPGERVKLKGKKGRNSSGGITFEVQHVVKDYGHCPSVMTSKVTSGTTALDR